MTFTVDVYLGHLAEVVFIKPLHCEVSLYTPSPCCTLCAQGLSFSLLSDKVHTNFDVAQ